jgi:hypothetical protein
MWDVLSTAKDGGSAGNAGAITSTLVRIAAHTKK